MGLLIKISQIGYATLNAIGPETFHGQHRGTGTALQATANRISVIIVSLLCLLGFFLKHDDGI